MTRRLLLAVLALWLVVASGLLALAFLSPWRFERFKTELGWPAEEPNHYVRTLHRHLERLDRNLPAGSLVFLGASHVQGLNERVFGPCAVNFGIGSDTARHMALRVRDYTAIPRAAGIVLLAGTNDFLLYGRSLDEVTGDLRRLLDALPSDKKLLMLLNPLPRQDRLGEATAADIGRLNEDIRGLCEARAGCAWIEPSRTPDEQARRTEREPDGLHLNRAGYLELEGSIDQGLERLGIERQACRPQSPALSRKKSRLAPA